MHATIVGAIAGTVLSVSTSYLVTGWLFHRFQSATPQTWRSESWRSHGIAIVLQAAAGAALGAVFVVAGTPVLGLKLVTLATGVWVSLAACLLVQAVYVRWHWGFVLGLLLDWLLFVFGVLGSCAYTAASH
jgi:hypothetical protein